LPHDVVVTAGQAPPTPLQKAWLVRVAGMPAAPIVHDCERHEVVVP